MLVPIVFSRIFWGILLVLCLVQEMVAETALPASGGVKSLAHIALRSKNIEKTLSFYCDFLGFSERFRTNRNPGKPNVYYKKNGSDADLEKERLGTLMLVDLRVGPEQSLELFVGRQEGESVLYHPAVYVDDPETIRENLASFGYPAPAPAMAGSAPRKSFFARDPSGTEIEVVRLQEPESAPPLLPKGLATRIRAIGYSTKDPALSRLFFSKGLGMTVNEFPGAWQAVAANGDRFEFHNGESEGPWLVLEVDDLKQAKLFLEARSSQDPDSQGFGISKTEASPFLELQDPDGLRIRISQKP